MNHWKKEAPPERAVLAVTNSLANGYSRTALSVFADS